jgi:hypothetical protein
MAPVTGSLQRQLKTLAAERLQVLKALSFEDLGGLAPDRVELTGRFGSRGTVWTDLASIDRDTLRVVVLYQARAWWWPSYLHEALGFRIVRSGGRFELTQQDFYDLD